jgi:MEMO1 family protein
MLKGKDSEKRSRSTWAIVAAALVVVVFGVIFDLSRHQLPVPFRAAAGPRTETSVRPAAAAGSFYPASSEELGSMIDDYLAAAELPKIDGRPKIILSPHAGYIYSGQVAAYPFKSLIGGGYDRAVLIGVSHRQFFDGVAADTHDLWETPLGQVALDHAFIDALIRSSETVRYDASPHEQEHSLEVMVPFLIKTLGPDVKIVPLLFGNDDQASAEKLALALAAVDDPQTVIVISSDLSHYPTSDQAHDLDGETINSILTNDPGQFDARIGRGQVSESGPVVTLACAKTAIDSGLSLSRELGLRPQLLRYADSGETAGDKDRAVGYASIVFTGPSAEPATVIGGGLNAAEQAQAIGIVRRTLQRSFEGEKYSPPAGSGVLGEKQGVFVTLKKGGQLRGCIGVFSPDEPLSLSIRNMAWAAAFKDSRFAALRRDELPGLEIEVSVLSSMTKVSDAGAVEIGKHGVYIKQGSNSGVFLPQVAAEQGWDKETFLSELCLEKAGLSRDCWQDRRTEISVFTAQVFGGPYAE